MAQLFVVHPVDPQVRLLRQAAQILDHGGVGAIPTDSCYALVCHLDDKAAVDCIRAIRRIDEKHLLTMMCRDLSDLASYAKVDNATYRLLRDVTPGPYTLILDATREVPRRLSHPSRRTIGLRIPDHPVALGLLDVLGQPLISTTLQLPGDELPLNDVDDIRARLDHVVDFVLDAGPCGIEPTTVVDLTRARSGRHPQGQGRSGRAWSVAATCRAALIDCHAMDGIIQAITVYAIPVLLAITLHEAAHGYVARMFGDSTAYMLGRVTLNPIKHIDPVGTIIVPLAIVLLSKTRRRTGFLFGWAKPVPVNFANLRHPKRDMIWVAAAGPGINLLMAIGWALGLKLIAAVGVREAISYRNGAEPVSSSTSG